jgi:peptide-methionine (S)-S-oxide reductase
MQSRWLKLTWLKTALRGIILLGLTGGNAMADTQSQTATFAGGCFWCMEGEFAGISGVSKVVSGYTGGSVANPTYEDVSSGQSGHVEAIEVTYDPAKVTYQKLLSIFWENVDPTDPYGQFCDKGSQYRAGIFFHGDEQKRLAEASRDKVKAMFKEPLATIIAPASVFYPAEDYHQEYYIKNKTRYKMYRFGCGRDARLDELWHGKPSVGE